MDTAIPASNSQSSSQLDGILNVLNQSHNNSNNTENPPLRESSFQSLGESLSKHKKVMDDTSVFDVDILSSSLTMKQVSHYLYINASPNNTIITLTRPNGSPLISTSGGTAGFKKAARNGYEASHQAALQLLDKVKAKNLQVPSVHIILKGFGIGRDAAFRALVSGRDWTVRRITDASPIPFGGCRPKKARRL